MDKTSKIPNFFQTQRSKLLEAIQNIKKRTRQEFLIIVADIQGRTLLDYISNVIDLARLGIHSILKLQDKRPSSNYHVLYLVSPKTESVQNISKDFMKESKYSRIDILALGMMSEETMGLIKSNKNLKDSLKGLNQLFLDFIPWLDNGFTFEMKNSFAKCHSSQWMTETARKLASVMLSQEKYEAFQIYYPEQFEELASKLQKQVQLSLSILRKYQYQSLNPGHPVTKVIIFPRQLDLQSPMMRSYDYLSLLFNFFKIRRNTVEIKQQGRKQINHALNSNDPVFWQIRYKDLPSATQFIEKIANKQLEGKQLNKQEEGYKAILNIINSNIIVDNIKTQNNILKQIMDRAQGLTDISCLEQTISNGIDQYGKKLDDKSIMIRVEDFIRSKKNISETLLLQIIALCLFSLNGVRDDPRFQYLSSLSKESSQKLKQIADRINYSPRKLKEKGGGQKADLFRHEPRVVNFFREFESSCNEYKFKKKILGGSQKTIKKMRKYGQEAKTIVFVTGYLGVNEFVALNNFEKDLIIGSNLVVSPWGYLEDLMQSAAQMA